MKFNIQNYPGSKGGNGTFQNIINHIPPHKVYCEPFLGGGAIYRYKLPAELSILGDINAEVLNEFCNQYLEDDFCLLNKTSEYTYRSTDMKELTRLFLGHYTETCESLSTHQDIFFYFDPPYVKSTRKSQDDIYGYEWNDQDHTEFLEYVLKLNHKVMISCYDNFIYELYLDGWNKFTFTSMTRNGPAKETIYMNYPQPKELHDYRYLGKNMTDRQRIQRKVNRHIKKLYHLPVLERNKVLHDLKNHFNLCGTNIISGVNI